MGVLERANVEEEPLSKDGDDDLIQALEDPRRVRQNHQLHSFEWL